MSLRRILLATLPALALALPAAAGPAVAVPALDFTDSSGEARDQTAEHADRLALFAETLRAELAAGGVDVVVPDCACTPRTTPFAAMAAATRAAGAELLLAGGIHKMSTLVGAVRITLLDLAADKVICDRRFSYRGDSAEAWTRAAEFAAADVLRACLAAPAG
ncbi:MAG TPA: DUF2380 domain-containing protein [Amaricoccus sp.]|uniref:DUF2380 domain-containing protein n=1 Tax=Amaricoccus sp. TaxID=1872485 RepID=UPI002B70E231|nr:DUF2380 domain-containing protein [Amaricoccus sp.]HRO11223.1 DUF2380 domain-containing protein [Amaricoccus sp.]